MRVCLIACNGGWCCAQCSVAPNGRTIRRVGVLPPCIGLPKRLAHHPPVPPSPQVATLRSAVKLEQEQQFLIAKKLQELTGSKNIKLKPVIDQSLIAGFVVEYGSSQIDLSIRGQVERVADQVRRAEESLRAAVGREGCSAGGFRHSPARAAFLAKAAWRCGRRWRGAGQPLSCHVFVRSPPPLLAHSPCPPPLAIVPADHPPDAGRLSSSSSCCSCCTHPGSMRRDAWVLLPRVPW